MEQRVTLMSETNEDAGKVSGGSEVITLAGGMDSAHRVLLENILLQEADNQILAFWEGLTPTLHLSTSHPPAT